MIIPFPQKPRLTITCEHVTETQRHSREGVAVVRHDPPIEMYFVDYEDSDGRVSVWDGPTYADAIAAVREWGGEGITVRDGTGEFRGRA